MAAKKVRMSAEGLKKLEAELDYLITVRRAEVAQKLKEARAFGDLSENAEYDEAKNEQGILEAKIAELEWKIANAEIVDASQLSGDEVNIGSTVKVNNRKLDKVQVFAVVSSTEANFEEGKISDESPIGMALLKKKVGDVVEVKAPIGIIEMEILDIN